jgi:hypothetical protein
LRYLRQLRKAVSDHVDDLTAVMIEEYSGIAQFARRCADRRDANGQMSLFTADTHFVVYMKAKDLTPSQELHSREVLAPVFAELNKYEATTRFVGQSTIFTLTKDSVTGETYCLAHHVTVDGGQTPLDGWLAPLPRYVREDGGRVAVCRAPSLCRLDR